MIERRRANGLRASSVIRLLAERMPTTSPRASTTGRWFTPAAIIAMLASGASTSAPTVWTGAVMIAVTGASRDACADDDLVAQVHVGDDAEALRGARTRIAERFSAIMISAASRMRRSGSQNSGTLRTTEVTGACARRAARSSCAPPG